MAKTNGDKELEKIYKELREMNNGSNHKSDPGGDLLKFFMGIMMLAGGLFMIFNNIRVTSSWGMGGYFFHIGSWGIPNGLIMLPLIVGIMMLFMMERKIFGWIVFSAGIVIVLLSVLASTRITWRGSTGFEYVIMFGLTAAGAGLVIRELFRSRND